MGFDYDINRNKYDDKCWAWHLCTWKIRKQSSKIPFSCLRCQIFTDLPQISDDLKKSHITLCLFPGAHITRLGKNVGICDFFKHVQKCKLASTIVYQMYLPFIDAQSTYETVCAEKDDMKVTPVVQSLDQIHFSISCSSFLFGNFFSVSKDITSWLVSNVVALWNCAALTFTFVFF